MAGFDTEITLFCRRYSAELRRDEWRAVHIRGAGWSGVRAAREGRGGPSAANRFSVRVPAAAMPEGYMPAELYAGPEGARGGWSVRCGDVVVKGAASAADPTELPGRREAFVVAEVADNRRGARALRHLRIGGA